MPLEPGFVFGLGDVMASEGTDAVDNVHPA